MEDKTIKKREFAEGLISKISPETVNNIIQAVISIADHSVEMIKNKREFEQQLRKIKEQNKKDIDVLNGWIKLIIEADLTDKQKEILINDIREIVGLNNGY